MVTGYSCLTLRKGKRWSLVFAITVVLCRRFKGELTYYPLIQLCSLWSQQGRSSNVCNVSKGKDPWDNDEPGNGKASTVLCVIENTQHQYRALTSTTTGSGLATASDFVFRGRVKHSVAQMSIFYGRIEKTKTKTITVDDSSCKRKALFTVYNWLFYSETSNIPKCRCQCCFLLSAELHQGRRCGRQTRSVWKAAVVK